MGEDAATGEGGQSGMLEKIYQDRLAKLEKVRALGLDPYGRRYDSAEAVAAVLARFKDGQEGQSADAAGRIVLYRDMGKMIFAHIRDQSGQMQIALRKDHPEKPPKGLGEREWSLTKLLDLGDIVAVRGQLHRTKTGEITIWADELTLLCKSLNPMPEKWHGLQDVETRYRRRYLDLMSNPEVLATFEKRSAILANFRRLLAARGFIEVETPVLQAVYGGAAARPFVTHHNTLDADLYLRISPELFLKRLLVGGMQKVFEFGRVFRNEGIDTRHNPEFTLLELYQAYADYEVMMEITEELIADSAQEIVLPGLLQECHKYSEAERQARKDASEKPDPEWDKLPKEERDAKWKALLEEYRGRYLGAREPSIPPEMMDKVVKAAEGGHLVLPYGDRLIDYTRPWLRAKYEDLLKEHAGVSMRDPGAVRKKARELGIEESNKDDAIVVDELFKIRVEPVLAKMDRPVFVMDYPADLCPLTRRKADDPSIGLRFECFIAGMEIANAYTELNDPAVQEENFRSQLKGEAEGETMRVMDEDFVTALRHGMPPAGGLGIGVDRVIMLLTGRTSIRDVVLFPMLRSEAGNA